MNAYQIILPIASFLYFLLVFVVRSQLHKRNTGENPVVFSNTDSAHDFLAKIYKGVVLCIWIAIIVYSFFPASYSYLLPIFYLDYNALRFTGLLLFLLSFIWTIIAQYQMGRSWRIGINYEETTQLVTSGLFRYSRNPIFLGVLVSYLGTFLIIPNALTFTLLIVIFVVLQIQVRLEEEYLNQKHTEEYSKYRSSSPRWL